MSPAHTPVRKQSSLLATQKNPRSNPRVFLCTVVCGQGESNSRLILGKDPLYHLTMAANIQMSHDYRLLWSIQQHPD